MIFKTVPRFRHQICLSLIKAQNLRYTFKVAAIKSFRPTTITIYFINNYAILLLKKNVQTGFTDVPMR